MTIHINGEAYAEPPAATLLDLVSERTGRELDDSGRPADGGRLGIAIAVDDAVIPRGQWARTPIADGQRIDLVTAVQGG